MVEVDAESVLVGEGGSIDARWFNKTPGEITAMLDGFVTEAEGLVDPLESDPISQENAIRAWVYAQAYGVIAGDTATRVGSITITNEVTKSTFKAGPDFFSERSEYWFDIFYGLVPSARPRSNQRPSSVSLTARFRP